MAEVSGLGRKSEGFLALRTHSSPLSAKVSWADHHPRLLQQRRDELQARQQMYRRGEGCRWGRPRAEGQPGCAWDAND